MILKPFAIFSTLLSQFQSVHGPISSVEATFSSLLHQFQFLHSLHLWYNSFKKQWILFLFTKIRQNFDSQMAQVLLCNPWSTNTFHCVLNISCLNDCPCATIIDHRILSGIGHSAFPFSQALNILSIIFWNIRTLRMFNFQNGGRDIKNQKMIMEVIKLKPELNDINCQQHLDDVSNFLL